MPASVSAGTDELDHYVHLFRALGPGVERSVRLLFVDVSLASGCTCLRAWLLLVAQRDREVEKR